MGMIYQMYQQNCLYRVRFGLILAFSQLTRFINLCSNLSRKFATVACPLKQLVLTMRCSFKLIILGEMHFSRSALTKTYPVLSVIQTFKLFQAILIVQRVTVYLVINLWSCLLEGNII